MSSADFLSNMLTIKNCFKLYIYSAWDLETIFVKQEKDGLFFVEFIEDLYYFKSSITLANNFIPEQFVFYRCW